MKPSDGGTAFPITRTVDDNGCIHQYEAPGMSLRDWFAGMALQGITSACNEAADAAALKTPIAEDAYLLADAMLAERERDN